MSSWVCNQPSLFLHSNMINHTEIDFVAVCKSCRRSDTVCVSLFFVCFFFSASVMVTAFVTPQRFVGYSNVLFCAPCPLMCVHVDEEPWSELKGLADEAWFISCDIDTAMERVVARQVTLSALEPPSTLKWHACVSSHVSAYTAKRMLAVFPTKTCMRPKAVPHAR